ncbi:MAG: carbohydrate ABC transporter permease [Clostridia bacterium]|nr:carbohydrate ABC transporter permease [Clostridia bacterium]
MNSILSYRNKKRIGKVMLFLGIVFMCLVSIFPYLWMVLVSLKDKVLIYQPNVWFFKPNFENYKIIFQKHDLGTYMLNSAIIAASNCVISLVLGCMTAYSLARHRFRHKEKFSFFMTFIRILPAVASVIPAFVIAAQLRMIDTHAVLIIVYLLFNIPFTVLMMRGFFEEISREIEEAAMIDGCNTPQMLVRIVIPLAMPGIVATAIFCIINAWNEFLYAMLLTTFRASTVPTIVQMFKTVTGVIWGEMSAVGTVSTLPVLVFAIMVQKHMVRGLSFGAVKD